MQVQADNPTHAVVCGFCGHQNVAGSKFCGECGAALRLMECPACEAINDRSFARCYKCGAELSPSAEASPEVAEASPELAGSAPIAPADAASEVPSVEPSWTTSTPSRWSPPRRTTSAAFVIVGLLVIAAAAYYGYRNGSFAPITAWLDSKPAYQALTGSGSEPSEKSAAYAPSSAGSSEAVPPQDNVPPSSATASGATPQTAPAPSSPQPVAATTPQPSSEKAADQAPATNANTVIAPSAPPTAASPTAPPNVSPNPKPAATCSDAAVAMSLCKQ